MSDTTPYDGDCDTGNVRLKVVDGAWLTKQLGTNDFAYDIWGHAQSVSPVTRFHGMWTFDIPQKTWLVYEDDVEIAPASVTGCVSSSGGAFLDTGTGGAGTFASVLLSSRRHVRYQPNRGHHFATALILPDAGNDGTAEWGLFSELSGTIENGCFFRLEADGTLSAVIVSNNVETYDQAIDTSAITGFDVTKGNLYDIRFQWRGMGDFFWYINQELVHQTSLLGTRTTISIQNPALPASFKVSNTTEDQSMLIGCVDISSEGGSVDHLQYNQVSHERTTGTTNEIPILSIKSPATINSKRNTRDSRLLRVVAFASAKVTINVYFTRDATALTGASFSAIGNGSYMESDTTATAITTAKAENIGTFRVPANDTKFLDNPDSDRIEFFITHEDYVIVTSKDANTTVGVTIEYGEEI